MWAVCVERRAPWVTSGTRADESISSQIQMSFSQCLASYIVWVISAQQTSTYVSHTSLIKGLWKVLLKQKTMYVGPIYTCIHTYSMIKIVQGIRLLKGHVAPCWLSHLNMMPVYQYEQNKTPVLLLDVSPPLSLREDTVVLHCFIFFCCFVGFLWLQWLASRYRWRIVLPVVAPIPGCVSFTPLSQEPASC